MLKKPKFTNQSAEDWLNEAYESNKEMIDKVYANISSVKTGKGTTKEAFITEVGERVYGKDFTEMNVDFGKISREDFLRVRGAFDEISRGGDFTPTQVRTIRNISGMKSNLGKNALYDLQNLTRTKGRFSKFEYNKMKWNKEEGVWIYDSRIIIDFRNSPVEVVLRVIG